MNARKRDKFVALAERRVNRTLDDFRLIGNLSNKRNYEYSEEDAKKIVQALEAGLRDVKQKFLKGAAEDQKTFKL